LASYSNFKEGTERIVLNEGLDDGFFLDVTQLHSILEDGTDEIDLMRRQLCVDEQKECEVLEPLK
jgi:hypothetical protein